MSDSIRLADHIWKDGGSLVDRLEHLSRSDAPVDVVSAEAVNGMVAASGGIACTLSLVEPGQTTVCARSGIDIPSRTPTDESAPRGRAAIASWPDPKTLLAIESFDSDSYTRLCVRFEQPPAAALTQPLGELCEAVLQILTAVQVREQFDQLRQQRSHSADPNHTSHRLFSGVTLAESFFAVAESIVEATSIDRVNMLRSMPAGYHLIASSAQPVVDRRSQQVRLLETLVSRALQDRDQYQFLIGRPDDNSAAVSDPLLDDALQQYLVSSGARFIQIDRVTKSAERNDTIAAIVRESFQTPDRGQTSQHAPIGLAASDAVRLAVARDEANSGWPDWSGRLGRVTASRKVMTIAAVLLVTTAILVLVPYELKLPVTGRVVAKQQQHVFAPMDANIAEVVVHNGQSVRAGDILIRLQSPELSLLQQQLQGEVMTAKTRSAAFKASGSTGSAVDIVEQEVLKTKIIGLNKQLAIIDKRMAQLVIASPIDGIVDRWDLQQALRSRPVAHGDYLLDIIAPQAGWEVELEIPEQESVYVTTRQASQACTCTYRLRLSDRKDYRSQLDRVSQVATIAPDGHNVVTARMLLAEQDQDEIRSGATVKAWVHCGKRSLGFVWLRHVIEWARQHGW